MPTETTRALSERNYEAHNKYYGGRDLFTKEGGGMATFPKGAAPRPAPARAPARSRSCRRGCRSCTSSASCSSAPIITAACRRGHRRATARLRPRRTIPPRQHGGGGPPAVVNATTNGAVHPLRPVRRPGPPAAAAEPPADSPGRAHACTDRSHTTHGSSGARPHTAAAPEHTVHHIARPAASGQLVGTKVLWPRLGRPAALYYQLDAALLD